MIKERSMNKELNIILTVLADAYEVKISINGTDLGIQGKKSESLKLFGKKNKDIPVLPPDMIHHVCLEEGDNSILVEYKRVNQSASPDLTIELAAREQFVNGANLFSRKERVAMGESGKFSDVIEL